MFYRKAHTFLIGCFWLILSETFAQDQKIADSLTRIYQQNTLADTAKFELLTDLSFHEIRDLRKGLRYAEELISLSEKTGNDRYLRMGYFLKGNKQRLLGDLDEALKAFFRCAEIARETHNLKGEGEAYNAIAGTYAVADNPTNAKHYYTKAIIILRQTNFGSKEDSINLASVLTNAGDAFLRIKNYDSALLYSVEAKRIFDKFSHTSGKGYCIGNIGMLYANIGKDKLAEDNINEAIHILEETQDYYPICVYLISMADVYWNKRNHETALNYTRRSLSLAERYGLKEQIADASLKLSELYENAGNINDAFKQYKKHITYRDSVNNIETVKKMADERTRYEVAQKQLEVNMLNQEKRSQQTIVFFLFIILGLTIMLLAALYWFYKVKSKEKMRVHQQELLHARLEIQEQTYRDISQELHDNIGQVLSLVKLNINVDDNDDPDCVKEKLTESRGLLTKAIQDLRDISKTLNTDFINEIGLAKAIDQQLQLLKRTGLYATELFVKGDNHNFEPERELIIFRIVQELLNNIVKHAGADKIVVSINHEAEKSIISVQDNGKGFNIQTQRSSPDKGLGLRNIHNRLKMIKGAVSFRSEPKKGTTATIEILK
jgi:signal transduction histidine kinase